MKQSTPGQRAEVLQLFLSDQRSIAQIAVIMYSTPREVENILRELLQGDKNANQANSSERTAKEAIDGTTARV